MQLDLQRAYSLPLLQYGMSALQLTKTQQGTLNVCLNRVFSVTLQNSSVATVIDLQANTYIRNA
jgi:hypothetical protein